MVALLSRMTNASSLIAIGIIYNKVVRELEKKSHSIHSHKITNYVTKLSIYAKHVFFSNLLDDASPVNVSGVTANLVNHPYPAPL